MKSLNINNDEEYAFTKPQELHRSNDTRWNSIRDELLTPILLEPQFTKFTADEKVRLLDNKLQGTRRRKSELQIIEELNQHTLFKDELTADDWKVLHQYKDLLEPCWVATMDLQGRSGDSKTCSLTNGMLDIEYLVQFLTDEHAKYRDAATETIEGEWHFAT